MVMDTATMAQQLINTINEKIKNLNTLKIAVIGKSGVGKSTLINALFRGEFAETGLGRPVTQEIRKIEKKDYPLAIYDTPGFELSQNQQDSVKEELLALIHEGFASKDVNQAMHCIWYCVNVGGNRTFDASELAWLKEFTEANKKYRVPVVVVLTQAVPKRKAAEMKALIEAENLDIAKVIPVLAQEMNFDDEYIAPSYGLDTLIEVMTEVLPDELQNTLQNLQIASLESKKKAARAVVATAVAASFGEGFAPIPFADAMLLIPTQVSMIAGITVIFGMDVSKSFLTGFVSSTIGAAGTTVLGKSLIGSIFKLLPGVGTAVGGVITGTTAGVLTTALGVAYIQIMEMIFKGDLTKEELQTKAGRATMKELFKKQLKQ